MKRFWMNLGVRGVCWEVLCDPVLCSSHTHTHTNSQPLALRDTLSSTKKGLSGQGRGRWLRCTTDFTGWFSVSFALLGRFLAASGTHKVLQPRGPSQTWVPLGMILPSNVAVVHSCLGSSHCFELHTIRINQDGINKALLFYSRLLKLVIVISGEVILPCLTLNYTHEHFPYTLMRPF